jgi:hypothetical protein
VGLQAEVGLTGGKVPLLAQQTALELEMELVLKAASAAAQMPDDPAGRRAVLSPDPAVEETSQQWPVSGFAGWDVEGRGRILHRHVCLTRVTFGVSQRMALASPFARCFVGDRNLPAGVRALREPEHTCACAGDDELLRLLANCVSCVHGELEISAMIVSCYRFLESQREC